MLYCIAMEYIDTHAHLNLAQFDVDREAVIARLSAEGVGAINVGTRKQTNELAVALAAAHEHLFAIVGIHPINVITADPDDHGADAPEPTLDYDWYKKLAAHEKVVGIGECGFDYFHNSPDTYEQQHEVFLAQVALANELQKPLMLHLRNTPDGQGRNAYDDALAILKIETKVKGNAHFFAGTYEQARRFIELGFTVSFTGVITFAKVYEELVRDLPLDMMHAETDCPYVAPVPYRGQRCEPWMVKEVYSKIAAIKGMNEEMVRAQLIENARKLYKLG